MQLLLFQNTRGGYLHLQDAIECRKKLKGEPTCRIIPWSWFNPVRVTDNVMGCYLSVHLYGVAIIIGIFKNGSQEGAYGPQNFQILQKGLCLIVKQNVISLVISMGTLCSSDHHSDRSALSYLWILGIIS